MIRSHGPTLLDTGLSQAQESAHNHSLSWMHKNPTFHFVLHLLSIRETVANFNDQMDCHHLPKFNPLGSAKQNSFLFCVPTLLNFLSENFFLSRQQVLNYI